MLLEHKKTLTFILAGGKGTRLYPLTRDRSKPAVPFAGRYRIIDFVLSNCINSGLRQIYLLTQVKSQSLEEHLRTGWNFLHHELHEFIAPVPPQQKISEQWYTGTADAIYQNLNLIEHHGPEHVLILSGDHIYAMDYNELYDQHTTLDSDLTISILSARKQDASQFGVLGMNEHRQITDFVEKPEDPALIPGEGDHCYLNMGIYLFKAEALRQQLAKDANQEGSSHDFGKNIIPGMIHTSPVHGFLFDGSRLGAYWRDVGSIGSYYAANMEFLDQLGNRDISTADWRIRTLGEQLPPAYYDHVSIERSIIGTGSHLRRCSVKRSVLGRNVTVGEGTVIEDAIVMNNSRIGRDCLIRKCILDNHCIIGDTQRVGIDAASDAQLFHVVDGIPVLPRNCSLLQGGIGSPAHPHNARGDL